MRVFKKYEKYVFILMPNPNPLLFKYTLCKYLCMHLYSKYTHILYKHKHLFYESTNHAWSIWQHLWCYVVHRQNFTINKKSTNKILTWQGWFELSNVLLNKSINLKNII